MIKKFTLLSLFLLLCQSLYAIDSERVVRAERVAGIQPELRFQSRAKVADRLTVSPKLQGKPSEAPFMKRMENTGLAANIEGLQIYNKYDIYDTWWKLNTTTGQATSVWNNDMLAEYNINTGFVRNGILYAVDAEYAAILQYDLKTGEYLNTLELGTSYMEWILLSIYDKENDRVYVYTYNNARDGLLFRRFDPETLKFTTIKTEKGLGTLGEDPLIVAAMNPLDGYIYGVTVYGENWVRIDPATGDHEVIEQLDFSPTAFYQGMVYSPLDEAFIYMAIGMDDLSYMLKITPDTGEITDQVLLNDDSEYSILYCFDQAVRRDAPAAPIINNVNFQPNAVNGTAIVTAPTKNFGGDNLTQNMKMTIKVDNVEIEERRNIAPGQNVTININNMSEGLHNLTVYCSINDLTGAEAYASFFIGTDVPAAPQNVVLTEQSLSWDAVTGGQNGGYLESDQVSYNVYIEGEKINAEPITDTTYALNLDTSVVRHYTAQVEAVCGSSVSARSTSNTITVGTYQLPLELQFDQNLFNLLNVVDANNDTKTWQWCEEHGVMDYHYNHLLAADDWAIIHKVNFDESMQLYTIEFDARSGYARYPEKMEIGISKTGNIDDMIIVMPAVEIATENVIRFSYEFKLEEAGEYYVGLHAVSDKDQYYLQVNNLSITKSESPVTVPDACTDITARGADFGALKAIVELTLPTKALNEEELDPTKTVSAVIKSEVAETTVSGLPGERVSGEVATLQGQNILTITSQNEDGIGSSANISIYTGVDTPKPAELSTIKISEDNLSVTFSWRTTTEGLNGGFVDPAFVTYQILIYDEGADYWFALTEAGFEGTRYTYTIPEGSPMQSVSLAITSSNAAGLMREGPIVTASLGTPFGIPMIEEFEDGRFAYNPLTIEHPTDECSGTWTFDNPNQYLSEATNPSGFALISYATVDGQSTSQLTLPKFTPKGSKDVKVTLNAFVYDGMAPTSVYVRGYKDEPILLGTITDELTAGWNSISFDLPEAVYKWYWAELVVQSQFSAKKQYFIFDRYSVSIFNGAEQNFVSDGVAIMALNGGIEAVNMQDDDSLQVFAVDGTLIASRKATENRARIDLQPGIYVARCADQVTKVIVK